MVVVFIGLKGRAPQEMTEVAALLRRAADIADELGEVGS